MSTGPFSDPGDHTDLAFSVRDVTMVSFASLNEKSFSAIIHKPCLFSRLVSYETLEISHVQGEGYVL
jgi:hypothetical protein